MAKLVADSMRGRANNLELFGNAEEITPVRPAVPLDDVTDSDGISVSELRRRAAILERYPWDWLQFAEEDQARRLIDSLEEGSDDPEEDR